MPKGEHFKKSNPRNTQVSFKVNDTEWERLKVLADSVGMTIPQWLRMQIEKSKASGAKNNGKKEKQQMTLF